MPRRARSVSIRELRRQLAAKERQLAKRLAQRDKLLGRVAAIDAEIVSLGGEVSPRAWPKRRKAGKKAAKRGRPAAGKKRARRRATGKPLVEYILGALKGAKNGMRVKDVKDAVVQAGYPSRSKDFYGLVATALRDDSRIKKLSRGVYALA